MATEQPWEVIRRAADLIEELANKTTKPRKPEFGWDYLDEDEVVDVREGTYVYASQGGGAEVIAQRVPWDDARWIAAMSPAVAEPLVAWLRDAADAWGSKATTGSSSRMAATKQ